MRKLLVVTGIVLLLAALLVLISCAKATSAPFPTPAPTPTPTPSPVPRPAPTVPLPPQVGKGSQESLADLPTVTGDRIIIRTGNISLSVKDVVDTRDKIAQLAVRIDGYVVSSSIFGREEGMRGNIAIRVPDKSFDQALVELRSLAVRVESERTNSQDVTEQYVDLGARLKVAEATESQYMALLDKAKTVEETLKIYDALSQVRREIEQIKGQMQFLERTSSMSLIEVQLQPVATARPLVSSRWSAWETLKAAVRGVVIAGQWLVNISIWALIFLPVWGTILGIIVWQLRRGKRHKLPNVAD